MPNFNGVKFDPITRSGQKLHTESDGGLVLETRQDVEPILEDVKERVRGDTGRWKGDLHHVARIPNAIYYGLPKELRDDPKALKRWLDHPDQRAFRTKLGRLS